MEFLCETDGLSIAGESEGVIGEYVTNVAAAAAEGCAAKGSVTTKSMSANEGMMFGKRGQVMQLYALQNLQDRLRIIVATRLS